MVLSEGMVSFESILLSLLLLCKNFERSEAILLLGTRVELLFNCSSSSDIRFIVAFVVEDISGSGGLITVTEVVIFGVDFVVTMLSVGENGLLTLNVGSCETNMSGRDVD